MRGPKRGDHRNPSGSPRQTPGSEPSLPALRFVRSATRGDAAVACERREPDFRCLALPIGPTMAYFRGCSAIQRFVNTADLL